MNLPKLTAEQSLGPALGVYINKVSSSAGDRLGVTGMMEKNEDKKKDFPNLPTGVFSEIAEHWNRQDLINFANTSPNTLNLVLKFLKSPLSDKWIQKNDVGTCYAADNCNRNYAFVLINNNKISKSTCCGDFYRGKSWKSELNTKCFPCNNKKRKRESNEGKSQIQEGESEKKREKIQVE